MAEHLIKYVRKPDEPYAKGVLVYCNDEEKIFDVNNKDEESGENDSSDDNSGSDDEYVSESSDSEDIKNNEIKD